jgi:hypothetical protein
VQRPGSPTVINMESGTSIQRRGQEIHEREAESLVGLTKVLPGSNLSRGVSQLLGDDIATED